MLLNGRQMVLCTAKADIKSGHLMNADRWRIPAHDLKIADKDRQYPRLAELKSEFYLKD
jgi:hypothetical protein